MPYSLSFKQLIEHSDMSLISNKLENQKFTKNCHWSQCKLWLPMKVLLYGSKKSGKMAKCSIVQLQLQQVEVHFPLKIIFNNYKHMEVWIPVLVTNSVTYNLLCIRMVTFHFESKEIKFEAITFHKLYA